MPNGLAVKRMILIKYAKELFHVRHLSFLNPTPLCLEYKRIKSCSLNIQ